MREMRTRPTGVDRGAVAVVVAVFAVVAMILLAFVVDRGMIYAERAQLQNAADAAALAAVQETCGSAAHNEGQARTTAVNYLRDNGINLSPIVVNGSLKVPYQVIVQDGPLDGTTGVSVAVEARSASIFGGFAGVQSSTVAARGSATRPCSETFRIIANSSATFTGSGSSVNGVYGGDCFSTGANAGVSFGTVAVRQVAGSTYCGPSYTTGPITDARDVARPLYGINLTLSSVASSSGVTARIAVIKASPSTWVGTCADLNQAQGDEEPWVNNRDAYCTGSANVTVPGVAYSGSVVAEDGDISLAGSTNLNGTNQLIYTSSSSSTALVYKGDIGAGVTLYAPNGQVVDNGANTMNGRILADQIKWAGAGASTGVGFAVRLAGPWQLSQ